MFYLGPEDTAGDTDPPDWPGRFAELAVSAKDHRLARFYQAGTITGDTPLKDVPLVALDFETTGLDPHKHGIVSIGMIPFTLNRIAVADGRYWLLKPRKPLADSSVVVHGITHSEIHQAPDLDAVLEEVLRALSGKIAVVHYRGIERPFLADALKVRIGESIEFPVIDTMALEARLHRQPKGLWERLKGKPPVSIRLADSRLRYGLPFYSPHHALTDALATAELFQAQVAHHYSEETALSQVWF
ncbi:3'-5' exonuclease [uncultured Marinobacter sp.]|uniref:3'-5' exonuclease n=1 Tax=uncultured Marinobacter sp. TaxID=187379 RepID=UPI0030DAD677